MLKFRLPLLLSALTLTAFSAPGFSGDGRLHTFLGGPVGTQELSSWSRDDLLKKFKKVSSMERDPENGKIVRWTGIALQELIDRTMEKLQPEQKAQIDLVIFRNEGGKEALVPRFVVTKYPVLVAVEKEKRDLMGFQTVVPWTSKSKILDEALPLDHYFLSQVTQIEFANYKEKYGALYLKRRTDPAAMRGEKIFVQNCISCHATGYGPAVSETTSEPKVNALAHAGHPTVKGMPKITERDHRALVSYLNAFRSENNGRSPTPSSPQ